MKMTTSPIRKKSPIRQDVSQSSTTMEKVLGGKKPNRVKKSGIKRAKKDKGPN